MSSVEHLRELVYIFRTEPNGFVAEVLWSDIQEMMVGVMSARYHRAIDFFQFTPQDVAGACFKAFEQALERYDYKRPDGSLFKSYVGLLAVRQMQSLIHKTGNASEMNFTRRIVSCDAHPLLLNSPAAVGSDEDGGDSLLDKDLEFLREVPLTDIERKVVDHKLTGFKNQQIATMLGVSAKTVANHYERSKWRIRQHLEQTNSFRERKAKLANS